MFGLNLRLYFKNIVLSLVTALSFGTFLILIAIFALRFLRYSSLNPGLDDLYITPLWDIMSLSWYLIVLFMFVGYEFFAQIKRSNIKEVLDSTCKTSGYSYLKQFQVIEGLLLLVTGISLAYVLISVESMGVLDASYGAYIILNVLLNVFLLGNVGIFMGLMLSANNTRLSAYIVMFLFALFTSPISENLIGTLTNYTGYNWYKIGYLFFLVPPSMGFVVDYSFISSLLPYRFLFALFWILFSLSMFLFRIRAKNRKSSFILPLGCFLLSIACLAGAVAPASRVIRNDDPDEFNHADSLYYKEQYEDGEIVFPDVEQQPFNISAYYMELSAFDQLHAQVEMNVDSYDLDVYCFTLYHGYHVKSVTDQHGDSLEFKQEKDFIIVYNDGRSIEKIVMKYKGYSPSLYSNVQGLNLPGNFAYYPRAGFQILDSKKNLGMNPTVVNENTLFDVYFNYGKKIYSNLENQGGNHFVGKSNAVTFLAGFYKETQIGDATIVYPYLDSTYRLPDNVETAARAYSELENAISELEDKELQARYAIRGKTIFVGPRPNSNVFATICQDHIITNSDLRGTCRIISDELENKIGGNNNVEG